MRNALTVLGSIGFLIGAICGMVSVWVIKNPSKLAYNFFSESNGGALVEIDTGLAPWLLIVMMSVLGLVLGTISALILRKMRWTIARSKV